MLEKKVVNVPTNKTYTSPEDIAALGKFLRKVKEKQEEVVTLQEDNLALPERDVKDGNIKDLKDHQQLIKTEVIGIDDLNKQIINLTLSEKIELGKKVSPLEEKELIDKLPNESEKISPSEVPLKGDKSLLNVEESLSLEDKREELLVKEEISLSDKSEKIKDNQEIKLSDENEKLRVPEDPKLDNSKEELKDGEEVKLSDKISKLSESQEIELETEKSQITDDINIPLEDEKSLLEGDQSVDLETEKSLLDGDKEVPLEDEKSLLRDDKEVPLEDEKSLLDGDHQVDLEDEKSQIVDDRDTQLENDSSKISDSSQVSLEEDRFNIKSPDEIPLEDESSPLVPPASENEITSYLKNYTGYSAGMKYLMNLSGEHIQLTEEEQKSLEEIKKYIGLASGDDKTAAKYQVTIDSLKKMGTWGEKFAAYLTAILNRNKNFRSIIPYSDIDLLYSAITSWEDKETGLKFKYGTAEDNQEGSGAKVVELTDLYNTPKDIKGEEGKEGEVSKLKEDLEKIINKKEIDEIWNESSPKAFSDGGKGESLRIPESKLPEFSWKNGIKTGHYLRYAVEQTIGKIHSSSNNEVIFSDQQHTAALTGATRQEVIDAALSALIIARRALEKMTRTEKYRLPGTGYPYVNDVKNIIESGINESSIIKTYQSIFKKENNQLNVPVVDKGRIFDPKDKQGDTVWEKDYYYKGNYNIDSEGRKYKGLEITLQDLCNIDNFDTSTLSNYNNFLQAIKNSKIITSANLYTATEGAPKVMTLDSNHVWEVILEPYLGPENGNISFLPAYREINQINESTHGFKTSWGTWIPITSYELNIKRLVTKTIPLYDGEITYPTGMEFTNELRITIADDQYKSWKMYFQEVMRCMAYLSRPHSIDNSFSWESKEKKQFIERAENEIVFTSNAEYKDEISCRLACENAVKKYTESGFKVKKWSVNTNKNDQKSENIESTTFSDRESCNAALRKKISELEGKGYTINNSFIMPVSVSAPTVENEDDTGGFASLSLLGELRNYHNYSHNYIYNINYSTSPNESKYYYQINYVKVLSESQKQEIDSLNFYHSKFSNHTASLEGVINPAPYKNVTFRCKIYSMTPQFSTIQKYDLLVILKGFQEEFQGEIDSGPAELSLSFSIVGENPIGESFYKKSVISNNPTGNKENTEQNNNSGKSILEKAINSVSKVIS